MAGKLKTSLSFLVLLSLTLVLAACGVKSPPIPSSKIAPKAVKESLKVTEEGVEILFSIPAADKPDMEIETVRIYYGYIPLAGDPDCPPCPPRLREFYEFDLMDTEQGKDMGRDGGNFMYLDRKAPRGMQALYRVVLIDARGRTGPMDNPKSIALLNPTIAPAGFEAVAGDGEVTLSWQEVDTLATGDKVEVAGYLVYRQLGDGEEKKLFNSPMKKLTLNDKTVENGKSYTYRVAAAQRHKGKVYPGQRTMVIEVTPKDMTPPAAPAELMGVYQPDGVYIRLAPQADATGFIVERRLKGGQWDALQDTPTVENTFIDSTAAKGKVYIYRAVAVDQAGNISDYSPELEISTKD